jgi:hypothetical protein
MGNIVMLEAVKQTPRQIVTQYAKAHGLDTGGSSERKGWINVIDKQGHWSEAWRLPTCETWGETLERLTRIEQDYHAGVPRPWEALRPSYTGKMKPLPSSQENIPS